ncbi:putative Cytochrome-b5 reductase [Rhodotorula taiwanensis]|uniref:NADH-cytochrome b5 reductase n=1 Tax=Rhodotorula taiwanensis TaxID=741276 RepID=A0A2S5BB04_9BASI|nr:putative Cytochrome-b5 reductase [Rhodotorula taiwanensis]
MALPVWQDLDKAHQIIIAAALGLALALVAVAKPAIDPTEWRKFKLVEKTVISPNTAVYRFELPKGRVLGLPIGQHVSVSATIDGKLIQRSYTPTSSDDDVGFFDLLIKSYPTGNISKHFGQLKVGDHVDVKGPKGQMRYSPDYAQNIGMIAGGTGITPMLQIIRAVLKNPLDRTNVSLIYANVNESDILLKSELDQLAAQHPDRFKVYYVLNNPPEGWTGGVGFVTKEMIEEHLPAHAEDHKALLCGPPPMISAMKKHLDALSWPAPRTVSKLQDAVFCF